MNKAQLKKFKTLLETKRDEIVKAAFFGRGSPLEGLPLAPGSAFYDAELAAGWRYDPDRARALLSEAGVPNGFTTSILSTAQYGMHKDTAEVVQQNLAAVGIQAELRLPDWATRVTLGNRGQFDIGVMGTTTDNNDADGLNNLIDGSLSGNDFETHDGARLRVPTERIGASLNGHGARAGVRPEKLTLLPANGDPPSGVNYLRGRVEIASFLGTAIQYVVHTTGGEEFTAVEQNRGGNAAESMGPGREVLLAWDPAHTILVAKEAAHARA